MRSLNFLGKKSQILTSIYCLDSIAFFDLYKLYDLLMSSRIHYKRAIKHISPKLTAQERERRVENIV